MSNTLFSNNETWSLNNHLHYSTTTRHYKAINKTLQSNTQPLDWHLLHNQIKSKYIKIKVAIFRLYSRNFGEKNMFCYVGLLIIIETIWLFNISQSRGWILHVVLC